MRLLCAALGALALLISSGVSAAEGDQTFSGPKAKQLYLLPGLGYSEAPDDLGIDNRAIGPTGIIGFPLTDRFIAEVLVGSYDFDYDIDGVTGSDNSRAVWVNGLYKFTGARGPWQPFGLLGIGRTDYGFDDVREELDDTQGNVGLGVFGELSPRLSLRADLRGVYSEEEGSFTPFAFVGLAAIIGPVASAAPTDIDGDGVADRRDNCPNTPPGRDVDANGCELDSDGDGVADGDDLCDATPAGTEVDARGCPPDADSDGDGVTDQNDNCPNTPAGIEVDRNGCAIDSDGDGVPNYQDACPDSEAGALVDEKGCYVVLEEDVTIDMSIEFDSNSADIRSSEIPELREAVKFLRQFPEANAVIEGHTDASGAESYNQQLSERRARSVYDYMITEAGIPSSRLTYVGYGETRPISSDDTAEGQQRNRRVSAVLSATREVRQRN